jgi:general secretion pathway protein G
MHRTRRDQRRTGFTLIEAIVIVIILGVLAAVIAPRFIQRVGQSKQSVAESNASSLASAMQLYSAEHGEPEEGATIDILWEKPADVSEAEWEPYVSSSEQLLDPWGNPFILRVPGEKNYDFDIVSYGADGKPGGEGEDADVIKP